MTHNVLPDFQLNDVLPPLSPWVRFGSLGIAALLGSTIGLMTNIPHRSTTQVIAIVTPDRSIQALVPAESINQIAPDQIAQMRVAACPYSEFGTLKGKVTAIATQPVMMTSAIVEQFSQPSLYAVTIQPQALVLQQSAKSCPVRVGMQGKMDIVLREESIGQTVLRQMRLGD
jgi:hypothetical protein